MLIYSSGILSLKVASTTESITNVNYILLFSSKKNADVIFKLKIETLAERNKPNKIIFDFKIDNLPCFWAIFNNCKTINQNLCLC